jgi:hypothetical protein
MPIWKNLEPVANGAVNTLRLPSFHLLIGKAGMSFPHLWICHEKSFHGVAASKITPHFSYPYGAVNLLCAIGN